MTIQHHKPTDRWTKSDSEKRTVMSSVPHGSTDDFAEMYPPHPGRKLTEEQFVQWCTERTRAEWVNGEVTVMSPVAYDHNRLQTWLIRLIGDFVEDNQLGEVCSTDFWLRLPSATSLRLTDLFFVAKGREAGFRPASKKKKNGPATCFDGAADLIIEIVSPDSVERDHEEILKEYQAAGVREYWIVDPLTIKVDAYELIKGKYRRLPEKAGVIHSKVLKGFFVRAAWLWSIPMTRKSDALTEISDAR